MKPLLALTVAAWSMLTLSSCIDLAALDGGGGRGYGGGQGYGNSYNNNGYNSGGYRSSGYGTPRQPQYNSGYNSGSYHDHSYDDRDHGHASTHSSSRDSNYFGGPAEWYKSGQAMGKRDRKAHQSCNYRRHSSQYDKKTESQFARGYEAGYGH